MQIYLTQQQNISHKAMQIYLTQQCKYISHINANISHIAMQIYLT